MSKITITSSLFGVLPTREEVKKYVLTNQTGFEVALISFGATVQSIKTRDRDGNYVNVVLGLNTLEEYTDSNLNVHFGGIVGRCSGRISNAEVSIEGVKYNLEKNEGLNNLHGGFRGFDMQPWESEIIDNGVRFILKSPDGDGGFPGDVIVIATYTLHAFEDTIYIDLKATTNKLTPIDLTNHAYFNLNGCNSGTQIYNHELRVFADNYLEGNPNDFLLTGKVLSVDGTKQDFREYVKLSERIRPNGKWPDDGYVTFFAINQQTGKKYAASVRNPSNGIVLDVFSDQNGLQLYTSDFLNVVIPSNGVKYPVHGAICLESQNFIDSVNLKHFPSSLVKPEGEYIQKTQWSFRVEY